MPDPLFFFNGLIILGVLSLLAWRFETLSSDGSISGFLLGYLAWLGGGAPWLVLLALVLVLTVQTTKLGYSTKLARGTAQLAHGIRGWKNVMANVGVPALAGFGEFVFRDERFTVFFVGALAAALADTMATEVGGLSESSPRKLTRLSFRVIPGTSGAITGLGVIAALVGSTTISVASILLGVTGTSVKALLIVAAAGFLGNLFDSLLGDTIQAKFQCSNCANVVETSSHCGVRAKQIAGISLVDNNTVNALMTASGGLMGILLNLSI